MDNQIKHASRRRSKDAASLGEVADRLDISRSLAYKLAREDRLPVPVIRLGRRIVVPRRALDRLLRSDESAA
jgi:excisionase family DNA binding protein